MSSELQAQETRSEGRARFSDIPPWGLALLAVVIALISRCAQRNDPSSVGSASGGGARSLSEPFEVSPVAFCVDSGQEPPRQFLLAVSLFGRVSALGRVARTPFHRSGGRWCTVPRIQAESGHPQDQLLLLVIGDCQQDVKVWYHGSFSTEGGMNASVVLHPNANQQCRVQLQLAPQPGAAERIPILLLPNHQSANDIVER